MHPFKKHILSKKHGFQKYSFKWNETDPYCLTKDIVIEEFDFLVARFLWEYPSAGTDLDIQVRFEMPTVPDVNNKFVGFSGQSGGTVPADFLPSSGAYLWWGLDDRNQNGMPQGIEGVSINIRKFIIDYPDSGDIIDVGLYCVWYSSVNFGNFKFEVKTYKGGHMEKQGFDIVNVGGVQVSNDERNLQTLIQNKNSNPATSYKVGILRYNKITDTATLIVN